jgi:hypothetical protein
MTTGNAGNKLIPGGGIHHIALLPHNLAPQLCL